MRRVKVFRWEKTPSGLEKVLDHVGMFHGWGVGYEEFEGGPGNFTTAIVEKEDGTVSTPPASLVQFMKEG